MFAPLERPNKVFNHPLKIVLLFQFWYGLVRCAETRAPKWPAPKWHIFIRPKQFRQVMLGQASKNSSKNTIYCCQSHFPFSTFLFQALSFRCLGLDPFGNRLSNVFIFYLSDLSPPQVYTKKVSMALFSFVLQNMFLRKIIYANQPCLLGGPLPGDKIHRSLRPVLNR